MLELNAAGFKELRMPHMAVLQFPGPDGVRPGTPMVKGAGRLQAYEDYAHKYQDDAEPLRTTHALAQKNPG